MCVVTFDWEENDAKEKFKNFNKRQTISWAVIEVTDYCNFNCKWCFANSGSNPNPKHMGLEKAEKLIETLALAGVRQVTISGGEPTVYPHLKEVIQKASSYGLVIHMNTNGYLLTEELATELRELGLSQVQINIDSLCSENHDFIRGKKDSHKKAIQALKNARKAGLTCVSQTVLTSKNEHEIVDIFKFARSLGLQRCRVWDMTPSEGCARENLKLLPTGYVNTLKMLSEYAYSAGAKRIETGDPLFPLDFKTNLEISGGYCVAGAGMYCTISQNGDVFFCATLRDSMYNIFSEIEKGNSFITIHKTKIKEYVKTPEDLPECKGCEFFEQCKGGCYTRHKLPHPAAGDYWCQRTSPRKVESIIDLSSRKGEIIKV